jgi:hypothetical protein
VTWLGFWSSMDVKGGPLMGAFTVLILVAGVSCVVLRLTGLLASADIPDGVVRCYQVAIPAWAINRTAMGVMDFRRGP